VPGLQAAADAAAQKARACEQHLAAAGQAAWELQRAGGAASAAEQQLAQARGREQHLAGQVGLPRPALRRAPA
jgi:hypothetical protein